jgi:hypothetical protein
MTNHFYNSLHAFLFYKIHSKAIMQYKIFSSFEKWLPNLPDLLPGVDIEDSSRMDVEVEPLSMIGGEDVFAKEIGLDYIKQVDTIKDQEKRHYVTTVHTMLPVIIK